MTVDIHGAPIMFEVSTYSAKCLRASQNSSQSINAETIDVLMSTGLLRGSFEASRLASIYATDSAVDANVTLRNEDPERPTIFSGHTTNALVPPSLPG